MSTEVWPVQAHNWTACHLWYPHMPDSVTKGEAFAAIESLLANGKPPHHLNVRAALGGRGSGPTLSRFVAAWFAERAALLAGRPSSVADMALADVIAALKSLGEPDAQGNVLANLPSAFERIGLTLDQLFIVLHAWESDLERREGILAKTNTTLASEIT